MVHLPPQYLKELSKSWIPGLYRARDSFKFAEPDGHAAENGARKKIDTIIIVGWDDGLEGKDVGSNVPQQADHVRTQLPGHVRVNGTHVRPKPGQIQNTT